jgi:hypothetical protein
MRNIFDQYSQPENRVTHALMTALNEDRTLLGQFLRELVKEKVPKNPNKLTVLEQQYPGMEEPSEKELERGGIPDGWIFDKEGWCVFIESKVLIKMDGDQIQRHRRTAERRGFQRITAVVIAPRLPRTFPADTILLEWKTIYVWLRRNAKRSIWAAKAAEYLEIVEAKLIDAEQFVEGTLTAFAGLPFGKEHFFTYLEGKRILALSLAELKTRDDLRIHLGMNSKSRGRPAISGRQGDAVWDFLSLSSSVKEESFTKYPHLTLSIGSQAVEAMVTVPNAVNNVMRRNLKDLGEEGFQALTEMVLKNLKPLLRDHTGAAPWFRGVQRRYPAQRATPFIDARIDFDLRTAISTGGPPKTQPRWLSAAYGSFVNKKHSNYQIQMGVQFRYDRCPELRRADSVDLFAAAWLACKPLIDLAR